MLTELLEEDPVGESESADPDALQDTVAAELIQDQVGGDLPRLLLVVWDDAADKVRLGGAQRVHQLAQLLLHRHLVKKQSIQYSNTIQQFCQNKSCLKKFSCSPTWSIHVVCSVCC